MIWFACTLCWLASSAAVLTALFASKATFALNAFEKRRLVLGMGRLLSVGTNSPQQGVQFLGSICVHLWFRPAP